MRLRAIAGFVLISLLSPRSLPAASARGDAALESLVAALEVERRAGLDDFDELDRVTNRLAKAQGGLNQASTGFLQLVREGNAETQAIGAAEEAISEAAARVRAEEDRRHDLWVRIGERARRVAALREEIVRRRSALKSVPDPVSGRWDVVINPGARRGVYHLVLDGTLVSGDYTLDGGFRGSLRGQYVGDKLTLQRVDSERGIDATFYGRLSAKRIAGTWEATAIAPAAGATAGTWGGVLLPERDETEGERP